MSEWLCPVDDEHGPMAEVVVGRYWACPICDGTFPDDVKDVLAEMFTKPFSELSTSDLKAQNQALLSIAMGIPPRLLGIPPAGGEPDLGQPPCRGKDGSTGTLGEAMTERSEPQFVEWSEQSAP